MNVQLKLRIMHDLGLKILRRRVSIERLANQALLIQNSSQKSIELYKAWFQNHSILLEFLCSFATGLAAVFQGKKINRLRIDEDQTAARADILFVGHLVDHQDLIDSKDRYYGALPNFCANKGGLFIMYGLIKQKMMLFHLPLARKQILLFLIGVYRSLTSLKILCPFVSTRFVFVSRVRPEARRARQTLHYLGDTKDLLRRGT